MKHWSIGVGAVVCAAGAAFAAGGTSVYINGTKASSRVKTISGIAYVPLADVARAYGSQVNKRGDGDFDIVPAGGANQVGKYQGKMGDDVFTGKFRFAVTKVEDTKSYTTKYKTNQETLTAPNSNERIIVVTCRIKNGTPTRQDLLMSVGGRYGSPNTALTTTDEQSLPPSTWHGSDTAGIDVREDKFAPVGITILPGAARIFNLLFVLPNDTQPKDLIFSVTPYDEYANQTKKFTDVRISLNAPTPSDKP